MAQARTSAETVRKRGGIILRHGHLKIGAVVFVVVVLMLSATVMFLALRVDDLSTSYRHGDVMVNSEFNGSTQWAIDVDGKYQAGGTLTPGNQSEAMWHLHLDKGETVNVTLSIWTYYGCWIALSRPMSADSALIFVITATQTVSAITVEE